MADSVIVADSTESLADRVADDFSRLVKETLAKQPRMAISLAGIGRAHV